MGRGRGRLLHAVVGMQAFLIWILRVILMTQASRKRNREGLNGRILWAQPEMAYFTSFYMHSIVQNSVTWWVLIIWETGKCILAKCQEGSEMRFGEHMAICYSPTSIHQIYILLYSPQPSRCLAPGQVNETYSTCHAIVYWELLHDRHCT